MKDLLRKILRAVIEIIREEIAWRRFLRDLKANPPKRSKFRDAISRTTLEEWKAQVNNPGYGFPKAAQGPPKPKPHATRKRTGFKKWWPHGKRSG